jgi:hypothetical protein
MNAGEARAIASEWLAGERERAGREILGAFFTGSINRMADGDELPATSDDDICIILSSADPSPWRVVKREFRGLVIEPFYLPRERFLSAEIALSDFVLACHLAAPSVIFDPRGILAELKTAMGDRHDRRYWILKRCPAARDHSLALMSWAEGVDALHLLNAIFFHSVQGMSQMLLLADLRDPTVKKSLVKARGVLENYGMEGLRGRIMHLLGADRLSPEDIRRMALDCRAALVEAVRVFRTPFEADNAISACMLPSIETEARDCIEGGFAAEILLWISGLHSLSMYVIENDSDSPSKSGYRDSYVADMGAMGLGSVEEARGRLASARSFFDEVTRACEAIASSNPRAAGTNKEP